MPETATLKLPYPDGNADAFPPDDFKALAEATEAELLDIPVAQLAKGTAGQLIVVQNTGTPAYKAMSGDATISESGVVTIGGEKVGTSKLANQAVSTAKLADGAATEAKIGAAAVATAKLKDGAVTEPKMATGADGLAKGSFSVNRTAAQTIVKAGTVVLFNTEEWDLSGWYDPATGKYTPQVAGIYRLSTRAAAGVDSANASETYIRKNGSKLKVTDFHFGSNVGGPGSVLVSANGSTDYFDVVVATSAASSALLIEAAECYFQGELVGRT